MKVVLRDDYQVPAVEAVRQALTAERVRETLDYDQQTGLFTWLPRPLEQFTSRTHGRIWNIRWPGTTAGSVDKKGYINIAIDKKLYKAHRLAFMWMLGKWPELEVDHINGVKTDNRWSNLRDVDHRFNCENMRVARPNNRSSGLLGVSYSKKAQRFSSCVGSEGKQHWLGYFDTAAEAHTAYIEAKRRLHAGGTL